jgi:broad specificity phosphatase PhoE
MSTLHYDERLREISFGLWEMQTFSEIAAAYPQEIAAWSSGYRNFVFPQGEAVADFIHRVQDLLSTLVQMKGQSLGLMTHGGIIRTLLCLALGLPVEQYLLFDVQPASLTILDLFAQGGVLKGFNL